MRRINLHIIYLSLLPLLACSSAPAPSTQSEQLTTPPAAKVYKPTETDLRAAQAVLTELSWRAKAYLQSEQKYVAEEPWHPLPDNGKAKPGQPVPWPDYTFPGGAGFMMSSHAEVPQGGEPVMPSPSASKGDMQATLDKLGFTWPNYPTRFSYTYTVGQERGDNANVTITAQANFDTSNEALYTMTLRVDLHQQNQEVIVHPIETTPEVE